MAGRKAQTRLAFSTRIITLASILGVLLTPGSARPQAHRSIYAVDELEALTHGPPLREVEVQVDVVGEAGEDVVSDPDKDITTSDEQVLRFLERLQDSQPSGLVPIFEASTFTTTYSNAVVAIAFVAEARFERARRIFDVFAAQPDPCPTCTCIGGYQQYRDGATGHPDPAADPNDFWIGDNAWLLVALKTYRLAANDHQYDELMQQLVDWLVCLEDLTPDPGIYSGFAKNGDTMDLKHPEGSIDVYGALKGLGADEARTSIKEWLDQDVWVPDAGCFQIGPANPTNLPTDNVSWGYLALGSDYECILSYAEALTARTQDRYLVEIFDREGYWVSATHNSDPSIDVSLDRQRQGHHHDLSMTYSWESDDEWFLFFRDRDVQLEVTDGFRYFFWLKGDGSGNRFEVKLQNKTGETFWYHFLLDFTDWQRIKVRYDQFEDFGGPHPVPLGEIGKIEFAVNNTSDARATNSELRIGRIWYQDSGATSLFPVDGFDAFESEWNWLFVEGTGQMAAAYCVAAQREKWEHYVSELTSLLQPAMSGEARGLPNFLTGGMNRPTPEAVASSWYVIASQCLNPFELCHVYLPVVMRNG